MLMTKHALVLTLIALLIISGGGATAFASNGAKPGDILFPIDRAVEEVQIAIATTEKKSELKVAFAQERITELKEIIHEETQKQVVEKTSIDQQVTKKKSAKKTKKDSSSKDYILVRTDDITNSSTTTNLTLDLHATTTATSTGSSGAIATTSDGIEITESATVSEKGRKRIEKGLETAVAFLGDTREIIADATDEANILAEIVDKLNTTIEELPHDTTFTVEVNTKDRAVITQTESVLKKDGVSIATTTTAQETVMVEISGGLVEIKDTDNILPTEETTTASSTTNEIATATSTATLSTQHVFEIPAEIERLERITLTATTSSSTLITVELTDGTHTTQSTSTPPDELFRLFIKNHRIPSEKIQKILEMPFSQTE